MGGFEPPAKFSERGDLTGPQLLEGGCWERGDDFFQGGCNFDIKHKLKSETFNEKTFFSVIIKNSNRGILAMNLVTLKR